MSLLEYFSVIYVEILFVSLCLFKGFLFGWEGTRSLVLNVGLAVLLEVFPSLGG